MTEPPPLIETPQAKAPAGGEADWFTGAGGRRLRAALFTPPGRTRGSIVLSGGRNEPLEKYYETIADFLERGFVVLAHDWRGQGLSDRDLPDRLKGHAKGYKPFLDEYQALLRTYQTRLPKPWVAVGHSMGGCLALLAMASGEGRFAGAVLSAPMLGIQMGKVSPSAARTLAGLNVAFGRGGRYVMGDAGKPFDNDFDSNVLTHDRARFARSCGLLAVEPRLALGAPTWGWLDFAFRATAYLANPDRLRSVTVPVVIVSAALDKLVDNAAQAAAARHLPQGKLITVPGAFHEILMETDDMRNFFLRAFDALTGRVAPKPAEAPKPVPATPTVAPPTPVAATPKRAPAPRAVAKPAATKKAPARKQAAKKPAAKSAAKVAPKPKAAVKPAAVKKPAPAKAKAKVAKPAARPAKAPAAKIAKAPAARKPAAKPATRKPAARKPAPKPAPKAAAKKAVARKPAAKKPAARKAPVKKP
jgi:lysophospholipase